MRLITRGRAGTGAYLAAILVVLADQATKYVLEATVPLHESIPVIGGFFSVTHVRNPGAAFGILAGAPESLRFGLLLIVTLAVMVVVIVCLERHRDAGRALTAGLTLILGGAAGNLIDRVSYGEVIDFLDFHVAAWHWPAFNVADAAVTIGVLLLIIDLFRSRRPSA